MPTIKSTKTLQKRHDQALESFHRFYAAQWGETRWFESLYPALARPTRYCAVLNRYAGVTGAREIVAGHGEEVCELLEWELPVLPTEQDDEKSDSSTRDESFGPRAVVHGSSGRDTVFPAPRAIPVTHADTHGEETFSLQSHWNMDGASVLAAHLLRVRPGDTVLDLCAAPGGKSIVLSQALWPELHADQPVAATSKTNHMSKQSILHANEADRTRYKRLCANLSAYLPRSTSRPGSACTVTSSNLDLAGKNAVLELPLGPEGYDRVLLDAPCSSERHVVQAHVRATGGSSGVKADRDNNSSSSSKRNDDDGGGGHESNAVKAKSRATGCISEEMLNWRASHVHNQAKTQVALLYTALRAVKPGGRVVYATCSIAREENDGVVEKVLDGLERERKKSKQKSRVDCKVKVDSSLEEDGAVRVALDRVSERTGLGRIALPDHVAGERWGPLYFCVLVKERCDLKKRDKMENRDDEQNHDDDD